MYDCSPGQFLKQTTNDGHIHCVQVLRVDGETILIKDFWETDSDDAPREVRAWVKRVAKSALANYLPTVVYEAISEKDTEEIRRFLEIEHGLLHRKTRTAAMSGLVEKAMRANDYETALELLGEWALLEKYRPEIYLLREECFRSLGKHTEADYERSVYEMISTL